MSHTGCFLFKDKLRNKWSIVMAEIETKRNQALRAEDDVAELHKLLDALQAWLREREARPDPCDVEALKEQMSDREADAERLQELCTELKAEHVGYPEKSVADALAAWRRARDQHHAALLPSEQKKPVSCHSRSCILAVILL